MPQFIQTSFFFFYPCPVFLLFFTIVICISFAFIFFIKVLLVRSQSVVHIYWVKIITEKMLNAFLLSVILCILNPRRYNDRSKVCCGHDNLNAVTLGRTSARDGIKL